MITHFQFMTFLSLSLILSFSCDLGDKFCSLVPLRPTFLNFLSLFFGELKDFTTTSRFSVHRAQILITQLNFVFRIRVNFWRFLKSPLAREIFAISSRFAQPVHRWAQQKIPQIVYVVPRYHLYALDPCVSSGRSGFSFFSVSRKMYKF